MFRGSNPVIANFIYNQPYFKNFVEKTTIKKKRPGIASPNFAATTSQNN